MVEIEELNKRLDKIERDMNKDNLTGLYNRGVIGKWLENKEEQIGIIMLDLDKFKNVNDTYGHETGDYVLKKLAELMKKEIRPEDLAVRYGGEEFVILLKGVTLEKCIEKANHIKDKWQNTNLVFNGNVLKSTLSGGVALLNTKTGFEKSLAAADGNLYEAKNSGRNKIVPGIEKPEKELNETSIKLGGIFKKLYDV